MGADRTTGQRLASYGLYTDIRGDAAAPALLFPHSVVHADDPLHYASAAPDFARSAAGDLSGSGQGQVPATGS
jgi:hypothetical protein